MRIFPLSKFLSHFYGTFMLQSFNIVWRYGGWRADISCVDYDNFSIISKIIHSAYHLFNQQWDISHLCTTGSVCVTHIARDLLESFLWLIARMRLSILQTINGTIQMSVNKKFQHVKRHAGPTSLVICLRNFMKILPCEWSRRTKFSISYKLSTRTTSLSEKDKLWRLRKIPSCRTSVVHWVR